MGVPENGFITMENPKKNGRFGIWTCSDIIYITDISDTSDKMGDIFGCIRSWAMKRTMGCSRHWMYHESHIFGNSSGVYPVTGPFKEKKHDQPVDLHPLFKTKPFKNPCNWDVIWESISERIRKNIGISLVYRGLKKFLGRWTAWWEAFLGAVAGIQPYPVHIWSTRDASVPM